MKNLTIICILFSMLSFFSCRNKENQPLYSIEENGVYGFIDTLGNKVIEPQYLYISEFNEGLAVAVVDTIYIDSLQFNFGNIKETERYIIFKYGYINKENQFVLPPQYTFTIKLKDVDFNNIGMGGFVFNDGRAQLQDAISKKKGFINQNGDTIIKCIYENCFQFSEGKAAVQKSFPDIKKGEPFQFDDQALKWGYIDINGNLIINYRFIKAFPYKNGFARAMVSTKTISEKEEKIGSVEKDENGKIIYNKEGKTIVPKGNETWTYNWLILNNKGQITNEPINGMMYYLYDFSKDGIAILEPSELSKWIGLGFSFVNEKGKIMRPLGGLTQEQLDSINNMNIKVGYLSESVTLLDATRFSNGYAGIKTNDKTWMFIDKYFIVRSKKTYENLGPFSNGYAAIKDNEKWGYVDSTMSVVIPCQYDSCEQFRKYLAKVYIQDGGLKIESYINKKGETVWQKMTNTDILSTNSSKIENRYSHKDKTSYGKWRTDLDFSKQNKANNTLIIFLISLTICIILSIIIWQLYRKSKHKEERKDIEVKTKKKITQEEFNQLGAFLDDCLSDIKKERLEETKKKIPDYKEVISQKKTYDENSLSEEIKSTINGDICKTKKQKFESIKTDFDEDNSKGIPVSEIECYVDYEIPNQFKQDSNWKYTIAKFPQKGCIVWPYRKGLIARRGYKEESFENELRKYLSSQVSILGNVNLLPQDGCRPYEPDIAIIDSSNNLNIRIDIEIDEPYAGINRIPTHYIGCGDEYRDMNINNLGWIVIRFTEKQVHLECLNCIAYISSILEAINPNFIYPSALKGIQNPTIEEQWTQLEAQKKAESKERELYLKKEEFGITNRRDYEKNDLKLTDFERELRSKVAQNLFVSDEINSPNNEKEDIQFDSKKHIYTYKGLILSSVSSILANYFPLFDTDKHSAITATRRGVPQQLVIEEWDCKGAISREVGTHLHLQIENHILNKPINTHYDFVYDGEYIKERKKIDISGEFEYYKQFINDNNIQSYRTEWRIFDKLNMIAGTVDFISKNGDVYDIYDWKRSEKVFKNNPYQSGLGELAHLEDTSFNRYSLQQNLYRFILEKNYGVKIGKMYLVVLHHSYPSYKLVEVPEMNKEVKYILNTKY